MVNEFTEQSQYNLGLAYSMQYNNRLMLISNAFIKNQPKLCEMYLRALFREMACKLKEEERDKVRSEFKVLARLNTIFNQYKSMSNIDAYNFDKNKAKHFARIAFKNIFDQLEKIDILLRDYLEKRGLLIPNKRDITKFENVE